MPDASFVKDTSLNGVPSQLWRSMANDALQAVASKPALDPAKVDRVVAFRRAWVDELSDAACAADLSKIGSVIDKLLEAGVTPLSIIEDYCAEAARVLGDHWHNDTLSFTQVSIGTVRIQAVIRRLYATLPKKVLDDGLQVAVIVRECEQHTLGSIILTNRLRLGGHTVWLAGGYEDGEILQRVSQQKFDLLLISVAQGRNLERLGGFIHQLRSNCKDSAKIVVGGSAVDRAAPGDAENLGADLQTSDINYALRRFGLAEQSDALVE